jgi:tetratricopeptide (TPR) repeat protein
VIEAANGNGNGHGNGDTTMKAASVPPPGTSIAPPAPPHISQQVQLLRRAAEIHLKERNAPADAVPVLERVTRLVPADRELLLMLCDAYTSSKREREAATVLEKIIGSFGNRRTKELSVYHHRLGRALATLGDKDIALTQLDMAFKIDPGSVEVLRDLGVLAIEINDLDRAQKTFRALLLQRLDSQSGISKGEVFYYLGEISMKQGDKAKAVQMLERAVENEPGLARAKAMLTDLKG